MPLKQTKKMPDKALRALAKKLAAREKEFVEKGEANLRRDARKESDLRARLVKRIYDILQEEDLLPKRKCLDGGPVRITKRIEKCVDELLDESRH